MDEKDTKDLKEKTASEEVEDAKEAPAEGVKKTVPEDPVSAEGEVEGTPGTESEETSEGGEDAPEMPNTDDPNRNKWYVVRVQSGRENTVLKGLRRRINDYNLGDRIYSVLVPTESISEIRGKKKKVVKRKLYPGYIFVEMLIDDDTYHFVKETPGVGDFVGAFRRKPVPMSEHEVTKMLSDQQEAGDKGPSVKINFNVGDAVKINSGPFENFDGLVEEVNTQKGVVVVAVTIFGRSTPVELEYWQVERI